MNQKLQDQVARGYDTQAGRVIDLEMGTAFVDAYRDERAMRQFLHEYIQRCDDSAGPDGQWTDLDGGDLNIYLQQYISIVEQQRGNFDQFVDRITEFVASTGRLPDYEGPFA